MPRLLLAAGPCRLAVALLAAAVLLGRPAPGQDPPAPAPPPAPSAAAEPAPEVRQDPKALTPAAIKAAQESAKEKATIAALKGLSKSIEDKIKEIQEQTALAKTKRDERDEAGEREANAARSRAAEALATLRRQYMTIASDIDVDTFDGIEGQGFNLQVELEGVLKPLVQELKEVTAAPREITRLEGQKELFERKLKDADDAIKQLLRRLADARLESVKTDVQAALESWQERASEIRSLLAVTEQQLQQRRGQQRPFVDAMADIADTFFRTRGLNLAIGVAAFLLVFLGLRFVRNTVGQLKPFRRRRKQTFYSRLFEVLFQAFVILAAGGAMLLAFYVTSDWMLLLLSGVFLLGLGWASLRMLPQFFEQARLLLNIGPVREGERIVRHGVPWRVERLKLYTNLINPKLTGGMLRLPIRDLIGQHSRPIGSDEVWFPTSRGDWVVFEDGVRAEVLTQSPDLVQLRQLGGALLTCRTEDFIGMRVRNLSTDFRVRLTFGVDYEHQAICTDRIPALMQARLERAITDLVAAEHVVKIRVEFKEAGASSLDYEVQGDFRGEVAADYERIQRAMSRVLVEACNEHGWVIPFTQVTIHNASA